MSEKQQQETPQQTPILNEEILAKIPTLETYCTGTKLQLPEAVQPIGCHNSRDIQISRALYKKDVGLRTIFRACVPTKIIQESGRQVIDLFHEILKAIPNPESSEKPSDRDGKDKPGNDKSNKSNTRLKILGLSVLAGVGAVVAAPLVITAAGFTSTGIAAGSFGAWLMSTYGGAVASGSLCAILQSAGAVGLSAGASTLIGLVSGGTTLGIASLVAGLKRDPTKTAGLVEYCIMLRGNKLITDDEWSKISPIAETSDRNVAIMELFELLLQKNIGLKTLCEGVISPQHLKEMETNVFNKLLEELRNSKPVKSDHSKCAEDDSYKTSGGGGGDGDGLVHGKLRVLAAIASVWLAAITPAVLSAFGLVSEGMEWGSEMANLFIHAVLRSLLDKETKSQ